MAPPREQANRTSSANPFKLQQYATDGLAMGTTLQAKATAVGDAADALARAGESIAGMGDFRSAVEDLAADWYHLDEFAGDVAHGFLVHLGPTRPDDPTAFVMRLDNGALMDLGQIGWADRDAAIAEAQALAEELQGLMADLDDGELLIHDPPNNQGMSIEQFERLAAGIDGRGDPAFAVAFLEAMGVNGIVDVRGFFHDVAVQARDVDRPREGYWTNSRITDWTDAQMVGVTAVLSTAMGTRSRSDEDIPDAARLDEAWVDRFERYGGDEQVAYSQLVKDAELPADVLVSVGNNHLGDVFGHSAGDRGPTSETADLNILDAIAANPDASVGWLSSDGIADGTDNIELVLTYDGPVTLRHEDGMSHHHGGADLYDAMAGVVESGLTHPTDAAGRGELMRDAITIVGADGDTLWDPEETDRADAASAHMHQALAEGVASNTDVVHQMVNDGWTKANHSERSPEGAWLTHDFLREVTQDPAAADTVHVAVETHTLEGIAGAPPYGVDLDADGTDDRTEALRSIGAVQGTLLGAESNNLYDSAEDYMALQERRADTVNFAVGLIPYGQGAVGTAIDAAGMVNDLGDIYGASLGELVVGADFGAMDDAEQVAHMLYADRDANNAILLAVSAHPERASVPIREMSAEEREAFRDWVGSTPAPFNGADQDSLGMGGDRAMHWFVAERWT